MNVSVIARRPLRLTQQGYILLFVMAALVVIALGVNRFAQRIDLLREQASTLQSYADGRVKVFSARALALYWLSTRPIGYASAGFVDEKALMLDGRVYGLPDGVLVRVQDDRGLLSINVPDPAIMQSVLINAGASFDQAASMVSIVEDYVDADSLRHLNGAEAQDYATLGLPPPRDGWMISVDELARMPVWRDLTGLRRKLGPWLGLRREKQFNPNTAPMGLLRAMWPRVVKEQWDLFETLRAQAPFASAKAAQAATGIAFPEDGTIFHASAALRIQVWAPGLPQALEYNLWILPAGNREPWLIHAVGQISRSALNDAAIPIEKFPVPSQATAAPAAFAVSEP